MLWWLSDHRMKINRDILIEWNCPSTPPPPGAVRPIGSEGSVSEGVWAEIKLQRPRRHQMGSLHRAERDLRDPLLTLPPGLKGKDGCPVTSSSLLLLLCVMVENVLVSSVTWAGSCLLTSLLGTREPSLSWWFPAGLTCELRLPGTGFHLGPVSLTPQEWSSAVKWLCCSPNNIFPQRVSGKTAAVKLWIKISSQTSESTLYYPVWSSNNLFYRQLSATEHAPEAQRDRNMEHLDHFNDQNPEVWSFVIVMTDRTESGSVFWSGVRFSLISH